jgi:hypothetical protein
MLGVTDIVGVTDGVADIDIVGVDDKVGVIVGVDDKVGVGDGDG